MRCMKLTYKSPLFGSVQYENVFTGETNRIDFGPFGVRSLYNRDDRLMRLLSEHSEDLKDHVPEDLKELVVSAVFGIDFVEEDKMYLLTEVCVRKEPNPVQWLQLQDWITGQLSDGWGESLEQQIVTTSEIIFSNPEFDCLDCEFTEEEYYAQAYYYVHPWSSDYSWSIDLMNIEDVELDVPSEDRVAELEKAVQEIRRKIAELEITISNLI